MENFKQDILKCINLCLQELEKRKKGISGESTVKQLENVIVPELYELLNAIDKNTTLPPKEERYLTSFANAFTVWGWNMQNPTQIFLLLKNIDTEYKELCAENCQDIDISQDNDLYI